MNDYLKVVYDENVRPKTDYPEKLVKHLVLMFALKPGMKLLEAGCGRGEFLGNFKKLGLQTTGLDISPEAKRQNPEIEIGICDVESSPIPYPDNCFDVVYSKSFIEHLREPGAYFKEAMRVLKPGGILITLVPDWESNYKTYFDDYTHRTPFSLPALTDIYRIFDFRDIRTFKFRQLPFVWKYPVLGYVCDLLSPFIPVRTRIPFLRWSRELMLVGYGVKSKGVGE